MPSASLRVQEDGFWKGYSSIVGETKAWRAVDDSDGVTHDGDASYIVIPRAGPVFTGNGRVSFKILGGSAGMIIDSLTVNLVAKRNSSPHPLLKVGFAYGFSVEFDTTEIDPGADWALFSVTLNPGNFVGLSNWGATTPDREVCIQSVEDTVIGSNRLTLVSLTDVQYRGDTIRGSVEYRGLPI